MIFESHAHYDNPQFYKDREALFKEFPENNIQYVINVGADMRSSRLSIELAKRYPFLFATVGVHPHDVGDMKEEDLERLIHLAAYEKVVAIGEIGLDYYYDHAPRSIQKLWFREQLKLANELALPVVIHSREASQDTYDILMEAKLHDEHNLDRPKGVIHCYSGHAEMALDYVKEGFMIGIGGVITFKNGKKLREVVEAIPLESIVVETDAPYLAPEPYRGKRNDSRYLKYIIEEIGKIKGRSPEDVEDITYQNGKRLFFD
jgi:TatD DNase family protein